MLVVKSIDVIHTDRDSIQIASIPKMDVFTLNDLDQHITFEMIHGQTFSNSRGERICIGMSSAAQTAIGLPFEVFESMNNTIASLNHENAFLRHENTYLRHILANNKNDVKLCKQHNPSERLLRCIIEI